MRNGEINEETEKMGEKQATFSDLDMMIDDDDDNQGDIEQQSGK